MDVILLYIWSPTCFDHACDHLQGGENKNTNVIKMCLNYFTFEKSYIFC